MPSQLEYVQAQAMQLSPDERNLLLERLIISLDTDPEVEAAWEHLADQRDATTEAGLAPFAPGDEVMASLRARLTR